MDAIARMHRLLLIGDEPILHGLLRDRLSGVFEVSGEPGGHAEALTAARTADVEIVLVDTDPKGGDSKGGDTRGGEQKETDPAELVAGLVLISAAPVVALSSTAMPGSPIAAALYLAGAQAVLHKPRGRLPLDVNGDFGDVIVDTLSQVATA
jgi:CheY-like chemotaxis protein